MTGAETLYLTIQGHSLIGLDVSECKIAEYLLFLIDQLTPTILEIILRGF